MCAAKNASGEILNQYTVEDVAKHNTLDDCWLIVDGKVYDVTTFADEHPGGMEVYEENAGKDCSEAFHEELQHKSPRTVGFLNDYLIGTVGDKTIIRPGAKSIVVHTTPDDEDGGSASGSSSSTILLLLAVLAAIAAYLYQQ